VAIFIDLPRWPAHGRLWSHLVSDSTLAELHEFAARHEVPRRGFERDHYDVPAEMYAALVSAGAIPISSREVVRLLESAGLRKRKSVAMARRRAGRELLVPPPLRPGDLVAVPAMAGVVPAERLAKGVARLESWDLRVRTGPHVFDRHRELAYLAGSDADRAADFTAAWMDPDVSAVMPARGGYGTQRVLDLLDWRRLAEADPKWLVGFSDVTALHEAAATYLGLATVHGHVVTSLGGASAVSAEGLRSLLMRPETVHELFGESDIEVVVPGRATGVLTGGNLAMLASGVGTSSSRTAHGGIVLLEDIDEPPYRIDRLLTQLLRAGWFDGVRGVVVGAFTDCGPREEVAAVLRERLAPLGVPMVSGFDTGHIDTMVSVPFGVRAILDTDGRSLRLTW
jgi:muramoyltetrapeptide carboxypeptidase